MVAVEPEPLELHVDRGGGHAQGDRLRQLREAVPEPCAQAGLTSAPQVRLLCAPTACAVGLAQAHRSYFWPAWRALCCPTRPGPEEPAHAPSWALTRRPCPDTPALPCTPPALTRLPCTPALHACRRLNPWCTVWPTGGYEDRHLLLGRVPVERALRAARFAQVVIFSPARGDGQPLQLSPPRGSGPTPRRVRHSHCMHAHGEWGGRGVA